MFKAIVFDMDGVLFDTETVSLASWKETAPAFGIDEPSIIRAHTGCIGLNRNDGYAWLRECFGQSFESERFLDTCKVAFDRRVHEDLPLKKGTREILSYLKEHHIPTAICSSTAVPVILEHLEQTGLTEYFDRIIGGNMVLHSKPQPDIYLKACETLGFEPKDCIGVEDSPNGIHSSAAAGLMTVMVPDLVAPNEELRSLCLRVDESLLSLLDYLRSLE